MPSCARLLPTSASAVALLAAAALGGALAPSGTAAAAPASTSATSGSTACDTTWVPRATSAIVFPQPGTKEANPQTQISFRGLPQSKIGNITVVGSKSGTHSGHWKADSDGRGASFYPSTPFTPGETVTVHTHVSIVNGSHGSWSFGVSTPIANLPGRADYYQVTGSGVRHYQTSSIQPAAISVKITKGTHPFNDDIFLATHTGVPPAGGAPNDPGQPGPMILGPTGRLEWFHPLTNGDSAFDFRAQTYRGQRVLTWWQGEVNAAYYGSGEGVIVNKRYQTIATVKAGNGYSMDLHDFQLTPEGTALLIAYQPVHFSAGKFSGAVLDTVVQEIDIPTGNVLFEWHSLDHVWLRDSYTPVPSSGFYDYFHGNSADLDSRNDGLLISGRDTSTEYFVSRYTGVIQWRVGGKHSSMGSAVHTIGQHDAKWLSPTSFTVFDDGSMNSPTPTPEAHSRGLVVGLNCATHRASIEHAYVATARPATGSQGSMQRLGGTDAMLGLGQESYFYELTPANRTVLTGTLPGQDESYRVFKESWAGYPTTQPAAKATSSNGKITVKVSWNGATEVTAWRINGGPDNNPTTWAKAKDVIRKTNFEDTFTSSAHWAYVRVQALDSAGKVIGTSAVIKVT
jgi:hypothetical protein